MRTYPGDIIPPSSHALFNSAIKSVHDEVLAREIAVYLMRGLKYFVSQLQIAQGEIVVSLHQGFPTIIELRVRHHVAAVSTDSFAAVEAFTQYKGAFDLLASSAGCLTLPQMLRCVEDFCLPHMRLANFDFGNCSVPIVKKNVSTVVVSPIERVKAANVPKIGDALYWQPPSSLASRDPGVRGAAS